MASIPFLNFPPIQAGDECTVVFDGTTPDIVGIFQRFISDSGQVVVTTFETPGDTTSPKITFYIDDYQYIRAGAVPVNINATNTQILQVGDNVRVTFGTRNVPGPTDGLVQQTGTIVAINNPSAFELDTGVVVSDFWYLEKLP